MTFYEPYTAQLKEQQREKLDLGQDDQSSPDSTMRPEHDEAHEQQPIINTQSTLYYCNKAICIVSRYPFFEPFRRFLFFLLNTITVGESRIPIERYVSHLVSNEILLYKFKLDVRSAISLPNKAKDIG